MASQFSFVQSSLFFIMLPHSFSSFRLYFLAMWPHSFQSFSFNFTMRPHNFQWFLLHFLTICPYSFQSFNFHWPLPGSLELWQLFDFQFFHSVISSTKLAAPAAGLSPCAGSFQPERVQLQPGSNTKPGSSGRVWLQDQAVGGCDVGRGERECCGLVKWIWPHRPWCLHSGDKWQLGNGQLLHKAKRRMGGRTVRPLFAHKCNDYGSPPFLLLLRLLFLLFLFFFFLFSYFVFALLRSIRKLITSENQLKLWMDLIQ